MSDEHLFEEPKPATEDLLKQLSILCVKHKEVEFAIEKLEDSLKDKKKELEVLSRVEIPKIFNYVNLKEITLNSGEKVTVQDKVKASIAKAKTLEAYRNMVAEEGGDEHASKIVSGLFKNELVVPDPDDEVLDYLMSHDILYDTSLSIHSQTLNKYCREKLESGKAVPEGISVFQYQETKIKRS